MNSPPPQEQVARMISGYWVSQAVFVAAKLGLADLVAAGPRTAEDLARATDTNPRALYRLLRALAGFGMFAEDDQHRFALTPLAECLRGDVPGSLRAMALMCGEEQYLAWGQLLHSVRTGQTGFEKVFGQPVFEYLATRPEQARVFDEAMVSIHGRETGAMLDAYDFSGVKVLADVGGGNASVMTAVLQRYPSMRGIVFDLPGVAGRAEAAVRAAGLADRCRVIGGSFFESVPGGADAYLLRHIIHDWDDEKSTTILGNVRKALPDGGRVLVVEGVIPPGNEPSFTKLLDLTMLAIPGGQERTQEEYDALFRASGLRLTRVVPTAAEVSVIEGQGA